MITDEEAYEIEIARAKKIALHGVVSGSWMIGDTIDFVRRPATTFNSITWAVFMLVGLYIYWRGFK